MSLDRNTIVEKLVSVLGKENVITEEKVLQESSIDRFRKYEGICEVYTQPLPSALAYVSNKNQISEILKFANDNKINVVTRTGLSSIEGGLETAVKDTIVLDGSRMKKVIEVDEENMLLTCECGVLLEDVENMLRERGLTTGHSPQSKPLAQMGGLVSTRSIGQFSTLYGGIEDMLVGVEAVFPNGQITNIKNVPRRAAGPDIRHIIMGSEGALCFITETTVKLFKYRPENNTFLGYLLEDMKTGFELLRAVMVEGLKPSVARLYDEEDGDYYFSHFSNNKCVLVFMTEGVKEIADFTAKAIDKIVLDTGKAEKVDSKLIENWFNNLNWTPEKIVKEYAEIKATNNIGFTTEISGNWSVIHDIYKNVCDRVRNEIPDITMMGGHSSHSYVNGTNVYFMYYYNLVDIKPEEEITKYHTPINTIIMEETLRFGGSIAHHHGVGKHRTKWIRQEHDSAYYLLETLKTAFDPNGIMNKGTLFPID